MPVRPAARRVLVIDGNVAEVRARQYAALGYDSGSGYARVLQSLQPDLECDIVRPADGVPELAAGATLADYAGAAMTGSALNLYAGGPQVSRQVEFVRAVLAAGIPFFGSCWGMQVAVAAAGGTVIANPRGREFGFARRIVLTEQGRTHRLYSGKPIVFEAPTIHRDTVATLPSGAEPLATNDYGLQAVAFRSGAAAVWAVQYHPEYGYRDIAAAADRNAEALVSERLFDDLASVAGFSSDLRALAQDPAHPPLLWKHALGEAVRDESLRLRELRNWLDTAVLRLG